MRDRFLFLALLAFLAISRLAFLGDKPYHHDESLFAYYGWELSEKGIYPHHPLLHGPLQIQLISFVLRMESWSPRGTGDGDAAPRIPAALCGILLLLPVWGMRRRLGREGRLATALLLCVSPGIWYYSRFCRNEALFLFACLFLVRLTESAWRSGNPGGRIAGACFFAAVLVALKENSLFVLFNGACFLALLAIHEQARGIAAAPERARGGLAKMLGSAFRRHAFAWVSGLALAWLLLEAVYTNGLRWETSFAGKYGEILSYWMGQHREHRLYGEFHYYLPLLALYEPFVSAVLVIAACRFFRGRLLSSILLGFFVVMGLWLGRFGDCLIHLPSWISGDYAPLSNAPGWPLSWLHMTSPYHLGLAFGAGWLILCASWAALDAGKVFRGWLIWWTGLSFLQYSYAGEKVPWLSVHIALPAILLAGELAGKWWQTHPGRRLRIAAASVFAAALLLNLAQGFRLCFLQPVFPGEILVYNHTQPDIRDFGREIRARAAASGGTEISFIQGEAAWPLFWYIRGTEYVFADDTQPPALERVAMLVCDPSYARKHPEIGDQFALTTHTLRCAWIPERLHPLTAWKKAGAWEHEDGRGRYGRAAWGALGRYMLRREPWGHPATTAIPLEVLFGRLKTED